MSTVRYGCIRSLVDFEHDLFILLQSYHDHLPLPPLAVPVPVAPTWISPLAKRYGPPLTLTLTLTLPPSLSSPSVVVRLMQVRYRIFYLSYPPYSELTTRLQLLMRTVDTILTDAACSLDDPFRRELFDVATGLEADFQSLLAHCLSSSLSIHFDSRPLEPVPIPDPTRNSNPLPLAVPVPTPPPIRIRPTSDTSKGHLFGFLTLHSVNLPEWSSLSPPEIEKERVFTSAAIRTNKQTEGTCLLLGTARLVNYSCQPNCRLKSDPSGCPRWSLKSNCTIRSDTALTRSCPTVMGGGTNHDVGRVGYDRLTQSVHRTKCLGSRIAISSCDTSIHTLMELNLSARQRVYTVPQVDAHAFLSKPIPIAFGILCFSATAISRFAFIFSPQCGNVVSMRLMNLMRRIRLKKSMLAGEVRGPMDVSNAVASLLRSTVRSVDPSALSLNALLDGLDRCDHGLDNRGDALAAAPQYWDQVMASSSISCPAIRNHAIICLDLPLLQGYCRVLDRGISSNCDIISSEAVISDIIQVASMDGSVRYSESLVSSSWSSLPSPPRGVQPLYLVYAMLGLPGYTMCPSVCSIWSSSHVSYQRLWRLISTLSGHVVIGSSLRILSSGRDGLGYSKSHGIAMKTHVHGSGASRFERSKPLKLQCYDQIRGISMAPDDFLDLEGEARLGTYGTVLNTLRDVSSNQEATLRMLRQAEIDRRVMRSDIGSVALLTNAPIGSMSRHNINHPTNNVSHPSTTVLQTYNASLDLTPRSSTTPLGDVDIDAPDVS
ncbi:hypothetical protein TREMEDRAFT_66458 [Tremella mesenterica DSM 1558]|uniref:uncharacterized protein n=1 Tax=Tremella mesenterica (strain ATCC 24925 / CBS 8224 / DSM 1558 / NBRC 9311 / NRRL Y-6157 / RJB 2259-6 / UBC 559-6) TaxID=578456 RepID=UPI00032CA4E6|nr:uncharacterized protein TREMEDRAFT_66458 [Tremella mesenterica DSM 1558]EIW65545.1 hypothetical protein TREMEDRAFT_66458 [Tremella mesenterica DSM 1558]